MSVASETAPVLRTSGNAARCEDVLRVLDTIFDPCSIGAGTPVSLVELGIVEAVTVVGTAVHVDLLTTYAGCHFAFIFESEAVNRLQELDWTDQISVTVDPGIERLWDRTRISPSGRTKLALADPQPTVPVSRSVVGLERPSGLS